MSGSRSITSAMLLPSGPGRLTGLTWLAVFVVALVASMNPPEATLAQVPPAGALMTQVAALSGK